MIKKTKQKEAILRVLRNGNSHPTASWIYDEARKELPRISLATVYRNLKQLRDNGEILQLDVNGNSSRFDSNVSEHYHFRCEKCGEFLDIDEAVDKELLARVVQKTGLRISGYVLEFSGLCSKCQ